MNRFPQYRTEIDGLGIHFLHVRSGIVPGVPQGDSPAVIPSLPGYGFSDMIGSPTAGRQLTCRDRSFQNGSRSLNFWILPVAVRGSSSRNSTRFGHL